MNDGLTPPPAPPSEPFPSPKPSAGAPGFLKWGLVGCAGLSLVLIVGLVLLGTKARDILGSLMGQMESQIVAVCAPEVTPAEKEAFRSSWRDFTARAKTGKVDRQALTAFREKTTAALADGKVTPEEIRELTEIARQGAK
jgi:hypothetical protein